MFLYIFISTEWRKKSFHPIDDYAKDGGEELFTNMHCVRNTNP